MRTGWWRDPSTVTDCREMGRGEFARIPHHYKPQMEPSSCSKILPLLKMALMRAINSVSITVSAVY